MANWFITGVSSGFGRALAEAALAKGHKVIGTVRQETAKAPFEALSPGNAAAVVLDVTDEAGVHTVVDEVVQHHGRIDVLVNNAGYGLEGAVEEVSLDQVRDQFEVNVFGPVAVMQAVLPHMRKQRSGHIINVTSMGGLTAFPGVGIYNGSKFALDGISEALAKEVKPLGIKVTIVAPGSFRTDWAGRSMVHVEKPISDYEPTAGAFRRSLAERNGRQGGDPKKAAGAIITVTEASHPPLRLVLGPDALRFVGDKLGALQAELLKWEAVGGDELRRLRRAKALGGRRRLRRCARLTRRLAAIAPLLQPLHDNEHRRHERDGEDRRAEHAGQYGDTDRLLCVGAGARGEHQRHHAEDEGERRHEDGAEARTSRFHRGLEDVLALANAQFARELDDEDGVLARQRDKQDEANLRVEVVADAKRQ
jgi:NAD(P)-dependent dehydrogenase (short-subunit alcohol dehydrogenase family)